MKELTRIEKSETIIALRKQEITYEEYLKDETNEKLKEYYTEKLKAIESAIEKLQ